MQAGLQNTAVGDLLHDTFASDVLDEGTYEGAFQEQTQAEVRPSACALTMVMRGGSRRRLLLMMMMMMMMIVMMTMCLRVRVYLVLLDCFSCCCICLNAHVRWQRIKL